MSVGRFCVRTVDTADRIESAQVAAARMNARNVGMLVVVNQQNQPVGIITDRDLALGVVAHAKDPHTTLVEDLMSFAPRTVREDATLEDALAVMRAGPYRRLPVVDAHDHLVGVLSVDDILDLLADEFAQVRRVVEKESPTALGRAWL